MFKVLKSFSGLVIGVRGRVIEIKDEAIANDLLAAGYIEAVEAAEVPPKKTTKKAKA